MVGPTYLFDNSFHSSSLYGSYLRDWKAPVIGLGWTLEYTCTSSFDVLLVRKTEGMNEELPYY